MSPAERRQAIARAVLPVLVERGAAATTRDMARAAGVAEGTLFSVFDTKRDITVAAIELHLNPEPISAGLQAICAGLPLGEQLAEAADVIVSKSKDVVALLGVLRTLPPADASERQEHQSLMRNWMEGMTRAIRALFERNSALLATSPERATDAFVALLMAASRPYGEDAPHLSTGDAVHLLQHGILKKDVTDAH